MSSIVSYVGSIFSGNPISHEVMGRGTPAKQEPLILPINGCNRSVTGQIVREYDKFPNATTKINFFVKDFFGVKNYVGSSKVDENGTFHLLYHWNEGPFSRSHELILAVVDKYRLFARHGLNCVKSEMVRDSILIQLPTEPSNCEVGLCAVNYGNDSPSLIKLKKPEQEPIHKPESHKWKTFIATFPEAIKCGFVCTFDRWLTAENVQGVYDSFGPGYPKIPLTPENLIDELLNKIYVGEYKRNGRFIYWEAYWSELKFENNNSVPNVKVIAQFNEENKLTLKGICIWFPKEPNQTNVDLQDPELDPEKQRWAIYVARSVFALKGESEVELAQGQILPSITAHAFFKYVKPTNPIYSTVAPHFEQADTIEWPKLKDKMFGKESLVDISALTENSVADVLIRSMIKEADYFQYEPIEPICEQHHLAAAEAKYFKVLRMFFSHFLLNRWEEISKPENWNMIYQWSESMHKNFTALPRMTDRSENPDEEDRLDLVQFLAWIVTKTTFLRLAAFSRRKLLAGSATLAMENKGMDSHGRLDPCGNALPSNVNKQNFMVRTSLNFEGDVQWQNPAENINQQLLKMLRFYLKDLPGYPEMLNIMMNSAI